MAGLMEREGEGLPPEAKKMPPSYEAPHTLTVGPDGTVKRTNTKKGTAEAAEEMREQAH